MVIVVTEEGIEVDGILLSNTGELQTFIGAHAPRDLPVGIGAHLPYDLIATIRPVVYMPSVDLYANISANLPEDLHISVAPIVPKDLQVSIGMHQPHDFEAYLSPIPYHNFSAHIDWIVHHSTLPVLLGGHIPHDLLVNVGLVNIFSLTAALNPVPPKDLSVGIKIYQRGMYNLSVLTAAVHSSTTDLLYLMYVWGARDLAISIGISQPHDLFAYLQSWHKNDVNIQVATVYPQQLEVSIMPEAEPGQDLIVAHRIHRTMPLLVDINIWTGLKTLSATLYGLYAYNLNVDFSMGAYLNLEVPLPMTTGYKNLFVTIKPATRIMSTIITVYTMEIKDLYISINQGWPCGFGSSYRNFEVSLIPAFFLNFSAFFKVIHGSGFSSLGNYINRLYFDTFISTQELRFTLPETAKPASAVIVDKMEIVYENSFTDIVQDVIKIKFPWPRFRRQSSNLDFSVELFSYRGDKFSNLTVLIYATKPDLPKMPSSQPLVQRQGLDEPVWPDIFQVKEIELWSEDSSEIVRRIEVMFGEQIHEYYWVSSEQRAYSKNAWEDKWSFLTRGYLPHAEFSGQIDYVTLREISEMKKYETIDQAMKAMIGNFLYHGRLDLDVYVTPCGGYSVLPVYLDIRGRDRISSLRVYIEPMRTNDLAVELTCV